MITNNDAQRQWREFTREYCDDSLDTADLQMDSAVRLDIADEQSTFTIYEPLSFAVGRSDLNGLMDEDDEFIDNKALARMSMWLQEQYIASDEAKTSLTVEHADYNENVVDSYLEISVTVSNDREGTVEAVFRDFNNLDALVTNVFDPGTFGHRYIFDVLKENLA